MGTVAFLLMAPWLLVLCYLYWRFFPSHLPRTPARRTFDVLAMLLALAAAIVATVLTQQDPAPVVVDQFGPRPGAMWPKVLAVLWAYAAYVAVIVVAIVARWLAWGRRRG